MKSLQEFKWLGTYFASSIGKKQLMGLCGAGLVLFLAGHLLGNLSLLKVDAVASQVTYNAYCQFLMSLKPFLYVIELGLVALLALHAGVGILLKLGNLKARGARRYAVSARKGEATPSARTMFISGAIILGFLAQHLIFFKYGHYYLYRLPNGVIVRDMWLTTMETFASPGWTALYVAAFVAAGMHLVHAIPSLFRTFGLAHRKWTPLFNLAGACVGAVLALGFAVCAAGSWALAQRDQTRSVMAKARSAQATLQAAQTAKEAAK